MTPHDLEQYRYYGIIFVSKQILAAVFSIVCDFRKLKWSFKQLK